MLFTRMFNCSALSIAINVEVYLDRVGKDRDSLLLLLSVTMYLELLLCRYNSDVIVMYLKLLLCRYYSCLSLCTSS